ncbi:unnamed protein product, partial [Mesorhabditis spiculigera]
MLRGLNFVARGCRQGPSMARLSSTTAPETPSVEEKPWENPWKHALPKQEKTFTDYEELKLDFSVVESLLPKEIIPEVPQHESYPTASGWRPPLDPPPALPYYVRRTREHVFPLYLERKRDMLNETTLDFDYVELVTVKHVEGDVFAFEADLRSFLEKELGQPVATHIDEMKGRIRVKGADRSLLERFLFEKGF